MAEIQNPPRMLSTSYLRDHNIASCEIYWYISWTLTPTSSWMTTTETQVIEKPFEWVWSHSIYPQLSLNINNIPEEWQSTISHNTTWRHRWELPILHYHYIMAIYPYPFFVVIILFFSWIIFINYCICIFTGPPG